MSKIGFCLYTLMVPVGLTILFTSNVMAEKKPPKVPSGREIFMDRCAVCHGEDGKGNGPAASSLKIPPGDVTILKKNNRGAFPTERVTRIVGEQVVITAHGSREMPIWGELFNAKTPEDQQAANEQFKNLLSYLKSIQE